MVPMVPQGDRALMAFDELRAAGVRPSTHTFNIAIAACGTEPGTRLQVCGCGNATQHLASRLQRQLRQMWVSSE